MHITNLKISNILGFESLEFAAGQFNVISGRNGEGKTSVLESIRAAVEGGNDATLLRKGQKEGEIVMLLDDGVSIRRRVTEDATSTQVREVGGKLANKPVDRLRTLVDLTSVNPIDFLRATKKDRARVLLEAMPLTADRARLAEMAGMTVNFADTTHALTVIDGYRKAVYDNRTGTNRAVTEKEGTINQLNGALPSLVEGAVEGNESSLQVQIDEADRALEAERTRIDTKLAGLRAELQEGLDASTLIYDADMAALRQKMTDRTAAFNADVSGRKEAFKATEGIAMAARQKKADVHGTLVAPLRTQQAVFRSSREGAARRSATLENITLMEAQLATLRADVIKQTAAIESIDLYKNELLASMPIPGIEIIDGEVWRNGVHFDRLNTAQQVGIAFEVAKLRAGSLNIMCVDGLELLDSKSFEAFRKHAVTSGMQLFISRVTDGDFAIDSE